MLVLPIMVHIHSTPRRLIALIREVIQLTAEAFAYWDDVQICWEIHAGKVTETNFFS